MKKLFLILAPILFFLVIVTFTLSYCFPGLKSTFWPVSNLLYGTLVIWTYYLVYIKGTLRYTVWRQTILLSCSVLILGVLFKLQHWPWARQLIIAGVSLTIISYTIHFVRKKAIKILDVTKLIFVVTLFLSFLLTLQRLPYKEIVSWTGRAFGLLTCIIFYIQYYNEKGTYNSIAETGNTIFNYKSENDSIQN